MNVLIRFLTACLTISIFITLLIFSSSTTNAIELVGPNSKKLSQESEIYGPVKTSDTLWRIALNKRPDNKLTIDQVMIAIFMANPQAFKNNDIHSITDGSLITIPSAKDIATISDQDAKRRIANNEQLKTNVVPEQSQPSIKSTPTPANIIPKTDNATVVTSSVPKVEIIDTTETPVADKPKEEVIKQSVEIDKSEALKTHLALAMTDMQLLIKENEELRSQISGLDDKIAEMQIQESLDIQAHNELSQLKDELESIELAKDTEHESIFNNGWVIALLSSLPPIALLSGLFFWLTKRYKGSEEVVVLETTPLNLDAEDDLLNEEGVLSDDLGDDTLLVSDDDELLEIEDADDLSELDEDSLFSDGEELLIPSDDENDGLFSDGEEEVDNSNILAQDDLEALLSQADDLENDTQENTDLSDEILNIDDSLLDESNELPTDDDIDALLGQANDTVSSDDDIDELLDQANDTVNSDDDIDALLDQANDTVSSDDDIDALLDQANDAVSSDDDIDALLDQANDAVSSDDDIDALLEQANDAVSSDDDIDGLFEQANDAVSSDDDIDELFEQANDTVSSDDDIDALLEQANDTVSSDDDIESLLEQANDTVSSDDIESLLEQANDTVNSDDDIESLLEQANDTVSSDDDIESLLEQANDTVKSDDDIESLLDQTDDVAGNEDDLDALLDQADDTSDDDIQSLLDQANDVDNNVDSNDDILSDDNNESIDDLLAETDAIIDEADSEMVDDEKFGESIDDLLAQTDVLVEQETVDDNNIETDDIDSLLEETNDFVEGDATDELLEEANNDSVDDIDSLLAETESLVEEDNLDVIDEQAFGENIDDLLAQTVELIEEESLDDINVDDVDSLLAETDAIVEDESGELPDIDIDNIDELLTDTDTFLEAETIEPQTSKLEELSRLDNVDQPYLITQDQEVNFFESDTIEPEITENLETEIPQNFEAESLAPSQEAKHLVDALDGMLASSNAQANDININELDEFITPQAIEVNDNELTDIMAEFDESNVITDSATSELDDFLASKDAFVQEIPEQDESLIEVEQDLNEQLSKFEEENSFIDIDKLLNDSAINDQETEPYQHVDLDMGLDEFPEIIPETHGVDVDDDPNGASKKLDLARAYLEIDDEDSALEMLKQIEESGDKRQQKEAKKLLKRLKS